LNINRPSKKELTLLMTAGCLLGILCFAMVYGLKIVNVTYDDWMFFGDFDLKQHYIGFCHFRINPWHFPIGLIDTLSVPYSMSVVYTDSIPIFAVIFKLFRNVLPETFQYFGLFGLICFMMMGALSTVLIRRFTDSKIVCIAGSLFYILSFPILQRMFYHTALSAQWIIVLALIVWFYNDITDKSQTKKLCIIWMLIGLLSVSVHSYFVFMTGIVLAASIVEGIIKLAINNKKAGLSSWIFMIYPLVSMGFSSFILLYILGGFYGSGSVSGDGFGSFNGNLSGYVNSLQYGRVFKGFENNGIFEFEGFSYVGAGILLILIAWIVYSIVSFGFKSGKNENISLRKKVIIGTVIVVLLVSCFPTYSFGTLKIIRFPVPGILARILGICRTNARFVWVGMYLIITGALYFIGKHFEKLWIKLLFAAAILIQLFDMSGTLKENREKYSNDAKYESFWNELYNDGTIDDSKKEFVFMYRNGDPLMMDTAYFAYRHNMSQNCYYYARTIYDEIDANIAEWNEEFMSGTIRDDAVYIFSEEDYSDEIAAIVKSAGAKESRIPGNVVVTR